MKKLTLITFILFFSYLSKAQIVDLTNDTLFGNIQGNFPGGQSKYQDYLTREGKYPAIALKYNVMGCTYIRFTIEKDSSISHIVCVNGAGSGTDEESLRLIRNSGKWLPGIKNGQPMRTRIIVPILYTLETNKEKKSIPKILGEPGNATVFSSIMENDSFGTPLDEVPEYVDQTIKFVGKVYGSKSMSDTVFVMTCADIRYFSDPKYINVVFIGKNASSNFKEDIVGKIIYGTGNVVPYEGGVLILINDRKQITFKQDKKGY